MWPGDAGVETAEEAVEPADPDINELCTDMFGKMAIFLQGELTGVTLVVIIFSLFSLWTLKYNATMLITSFSVFPCHCLNPLCTFSGICEDYCLLENMNKLTSLKYMEMKDISVNISRNLQDLNNKCE